MRLLAPLHALGLARRLGRHRLRARPLRQVALLRHPWLYATGPDPQLTLEAPSGRLPRGLALVSFRWTAHHDAPDAICAPVLYVDQGSGFQQASSHSLATVRSGVSTTLVDLPAQVTALRLDPMNCAGEFCLTDVEVQEVRFLPLHDLVRLSAALVVPANLEAAPALDRSSYDEWVRRYDRLDRPEREAIERGVLAWNRRPRFSVRMVAEDVPEAWRSAAVASLRRQLYPEWTLDEPGAGADYTVFLEPTAVLHPLALYYIARAIREHGGPALVYTDEDRLMPDGSRSEPCFKTDWNPELLLARDCVGGLAALRADRMDPVSGSATAIDRRTVRDLVLRLGDTVAAADVVHVPRVLCHRRVADATLPADDVEIVRRALARRRVEADVLPGDTGLRIRYRTSSPPSVTVVIATRDHLDLLRIALESVLEKTTYEPFDVLIVDNDSVEPQALSYLDEAGRRPQVRVVRSPGPFNYSAIHNRALDAIASEIVVLLNNDTEVLTSDWLTELVSHAVRPEVGAAGAKLLFPDGTLQHAGVVLGATGIANHAFLGACEDAPAARGRTHVVQEYSAVTAACLAMRRNLFVEMGGFDASRLAVRFNDVDLCLRLREAGYRIVWTPHAALRHHQAASIGPHDDTPETWARFAAEVSHMSERWGDALLRDPFYSPNLDLNAADFSLAFPPRLPRYDLP